MPHRPFVRFLVHGAERSGPPIYLLRLLRWWAVHPPAFDVEVVVAQPGPLLDEFRACAPVRLARLDRRSPERVAERALAAVGSSGPGSRLVEGATRHRAPTTRTPLITVVNGATAATARLLKSLGAPGGLAVIAHELSTGWLHNIDDEARAALLRAERFLAVSRCVERFLVDELSVAPERVTVVPPAVDRAELPESSGSGRSDEVLTVGGGGMTDWRKAPEIWLNVALEVRRRAPTLPVEFVWFGGDAPSSPAFWPLAHEIRHLGLDDVVSFRGDLVDPMSTIAHCDIFVSTAREDAYPLVCAESALAGVPVVAFDSGGAAELVGDAGCGEIIDYPDVGEMADRIVDLAHDPERRAAFGRRGHAFALEHLDVSVVAPRVEAWLQLDVAA